MSLEQKRNRVANQALSNKSVQIAHIRAQHILLRVRVRPELVLMWSSWDGGDALGQSGHVLDLNVEQEVPTLRNSVLQRSNGGLFACRAFHGARSVQRPTFEWEMGKYEA